MKKKAGFSPNKDAMDPMVKANILILAVFLCLALSGCAAISGIIQLPFTVLGKVFQLIRQVPKPPPGVF